MATIQLVLRKKTNKAGLFPLAVRLTKDRKSSYLFTGQYIEEKFWDSKFNRVKKSHPNSKRINNFLLKKLSEANDKLLDSEGIDQSVKKIKKKIVGEIKKDFFQASEIFLANLLIRKKFNQYYNQGKRLEIFKTFVGSQKLSFTELDVTLLKGFEAHLLYERKRKVAPRTVINYLMLIRTIYNFARKEFDVDDKNYPFGKGKIQIKFPETEKIGLNEHEIQLLENVTKITQAQQHAVNIWLFSFYFAGVRVGDELKLLWSDFKDGRLYYRMGKNQKLVSLAVPDKAQYILNFYVDDKEGKDSLVFPYLKGTNLKDEEHVAKRVKTITRNINRRLEIVAQNLGIEKKLSTHIARHSFGNISGDKIPIQMLQKLYRHSSITTTVNYQQNFMHKETDEALDKVINF